MSLFFFFFFVHEKQSTEHRRRHLILPRTHVLPPRYFSLPSRQPPLSSSSSVPCVGPKLETIRKREKSGLDDREINR
ncbi:hypothetical protein CSUI_002789 [Cystoisospora suis]|uniref:Uncharacterized protein n=1 Tax=Cystoisospora suis TaxID=483139 RepID=A0A2C6L7I0_9APIC|nr:hypothetical protein CSUI_002789 [Cystoisospora suis]